MTHRFAWIEPTPGDGSGQSSQAPQSSQSFQVAKKRRRVGNPIACEACRRKKIRCDGSRPNCAACQGHTEPCTYRDETSLSKDAARATIDTIALLNSLTDSEAIRALRLVQGETDAETILTTIKQAHGTGSSLSPTSDGIDTIREGFGSAELEAQNPIAYPRLPSIEVDELDDESFSQLTGSERASTLSASERPTSKRPSIWPRAAASALFNPNRDVSGDSPLTPDLCDPRLNHLDISFWTNVEIDDELAARIISLYLQTDHPLLAPFDADLFVRDLTSRRSDYCSSLLVNALFYWSCQMYSTINEEAEAFVVPFRIEAEKLWTAERDNPTLLSMASAQFLSLSYLGQGMDDAVLRYLAAGTDIGHHLGLFGGEEDVEAEPLRNSTPESKRAHMYAAWGVFNWTHLIALFYRQAGIKLPRGRPRVPIPGDDEATGPGASSSQYIAQTFQHLCRMWAIMHEVCLAYCVNTTAAIANSDLSSLQFAEYKFREMLAWSNSLPSHFSRAQNNAHHILILHLWFHAAVLEIFRRHAHPDEPNASLRRLRTFSNPESSVQSVCDASVAQLKRLILIYRLNYRSSTYTVLWHTALIYVANAMLQHIEDDEDWFFYFMVCVSGYENLRGSWRVAKVIAKALLSMSIRSGGVSSDTANRMLLELQNSNDRADTDDLRAPFMVDFELATRDPTFASGESLAANFDQNMMVKELTTLYDSNDTSMTDETSD